MIGSSPDRSDSNFACQKPVGCVIGNITLEYVLSRFIDLEINKYQPSSYLGRPMKPRQIKINPESFSLTSMINFGKLLDFNCVSKAKNPIRSQKIIKMDLDLTRKGKNLFIQKLEI